MHTWIFGNPQTGKTTTLIDFALQDIEAGKAVLFVDLDGSATDTILRHFPKRNPQEVLIIDPSDVEHPVGWNILDSVPKPQRPFFASLLRDTIKALWNYTGLSTPVMDRMIYNTVACLLEVPGTSLLSIEPMLTDKAYRTRVLEKVSDPFVLRKWRYWGSKHPRDYDLLISSTENKAGEFSEDPRIRNVIGQARSTFDLKQLLFEKKVILLRVPEGECGIGKASMFASLFLAHIQAVVQSRKIHIPLSIYLPNCHYFDTPVLRQLLSNGSRYGVSLYLSNQFLAQLSLELRSSMIGNCATRIMFRTGTEDSQYLHKTIPYNNTTPMLHELEPHQALHFDGTLSEWTAPMPREGGSKRRFKTIVSQSRRLYGSKRAEVERQIAGAS